MINVAFDIDDVLWKIDRKHLRQIPDYNMIGVLMWFHDNGDQVFVWSAGGIDYAKTIVDNLGLTDFVKVIEKESYKKLHNRLEIDLAFDDCETKLAKVDVNVKREHWPKCLSCGKELVPELEAKDYNTKEWDQHTFRCECLPGKRISIG